MKNKMQLCKLTKQYHKKYHQAMESFQQQGVPLIAEPTCVGSKSSIFPLMSDHFKVCSSNYPCLKSKGLLPNGLISTSPIKKGTILGPYPGDIRLPNSDLDDLYTYSVTLNDKEYNLTPPDVNATFLPRINSISFDYEDVCQSRFEKFLHKVIGDRNQDFSFYIPSSEINIKAIGFDDCIFYQAKKSIPAGKELISNYKSQYLDIMMQKYVFPKWKKMLSHSMQDKILYQIIMHEWYKLNQKYSNDENKSICEEHLKKTCQELKKLLI
jgi:hypothetical protein